MANQPGDGDRRREFTARLLEAFEESGLAQNELARRLTALGLKASGGTVNGWVKRGAIPSGEYLIVLPDLLGVSGHWLLTGLGPKKPVITPDETTSRIVAEIVGFARDLQDRYAGAAAAPNGAAPSATRPADVQIALNLLEAVRQAEVLLQPTQPQAVPRRAQGS